VDAIPKTFDEIAVEQGWSEDSKLWLCRQVIADAFLYDELDRAARKQADEENAQGDIWREGASKAT
jgi:hypothetical protein